MIGTIPCSVCILTRNNEKTLARALESVRGFAEIIVCDGGSSDGTLDIARQYGARVVPQDAASLGEGGRIVDFSGVRNACSAAAAHEWLLHLDADEYASPQLATEIAQVIAAGKPAVYWVPRKYVLDGVVIERSVSYPNQQARFFHHAATSGFRKPIHERVEPLPGTEALWLRSPLLVPVGLSREEQRAKTRRYIAIELDRQAPISAGTCWRIVRGSLKVSLLYLLRFARLLMPPYRGARMPLTRDLDALRYQSALALGAIRRYVSRA